jgi:hypothetical protein
MLALARKVHFAERLLPPLHFLAAPRHLIGIYYLKFRFWAFYTSMTMMQRGVHPQDCHRHREREILLCFCLQPSGASGGGRHRPSHLIVWYTARELDETRWLAEALQLVATDREEEEEEEEVEVEEEKGAKGIIGNEAGKLGEEQRDHRQT